MTKTPDATRRSDRSRRAILDAALTLVGEVGYNKLTIEAIAARAGVGKQTIYRWWPSKAAVLLDASLALAGDAETEGGWTGFPDTGDLAGDL
ncbi:TetR/AcrR family transcriptional regulator, partial [Streptomyces sp. NPDC041003]